MQYLWSALWWGMPMVSSGLFYPVKFLTWGKGFMAEDSINNISYVHLMWDCNSERGAGVYLWEDEDGRELAKPCPKLDAELAASPHTVTCRVDSSRGKVSLSPFYRWGNWSSEKPSSLSNSLSQVGFYGKQSWRWKFPCRILLGNDFGTPPVGCRAGGKEVGWDRGEVELGLSQWSRQPARWQLCCWNDPELGEGARPLYPCVDQSLDTGCSWKQMWPWARHFSAAEAAPTEDRWSSGPWTGTLQSPRKNTTEKTSSYSLWATTGSGLFLNHIASLCPGCV